MKASGFLDLPTELRFLIYTFIHAPILLMFRSRFRPTETAILAISTRGVRQANSYNPVVLATMLLVCRKTFGEIFGEIFDGRRMRHWVRMNRQSIYGNTVFFSKRPEVIQYFSWEHPIVAYQIPKMELFFTARHLTTKWLKQLTVYFHLRQLDFVELLAHGSPESRIVRSAKTLSGIRINIVFAYGEKDLGTSAFDALM